MSEIFNPSVDIVRLANSLVATSDGKQFKLGKVWQSKPAVIIFLRHFACIACRAHVSQIWANKDQYKNFSLVFIGNGSADFIEKFREDLNLDGALILTDPSLDVFRAAGFRNGFFYVIQKDSIVNAFDLMKKGHRQTRYTKKAGTHWQLGGVMVIKVNGEISYHYISESLGDFPEEPDLEVIIEDEKRIREENKK